MSHAELSPSSHHRYGPCPGSVALCRGIEREDTSYSSEGTFAHHYAALCLLDGVDAARMIGSTCDVGDHIKSGQFTVTEEMADHIQVYLDAVRSTVMLNDGTLMVEKKVIVNDDVYGTADALVFGHRRIDVFDFKYGAGVFVSVNGNPQLHDYGLGSLLTFPVLCEGADSAGLHVVQPRCPADRLWRTTEVPTSWLRNEWAKTVANDVAATKRPDAPLIPGEHCKFCPAKPTCPKLRERALATASAVFSNLDEPPMKPTSPANLTPEQIATVMDGKKILESWLDGCVEMAIDYAKKGELPRYKMVAKEGLRKWNDEGVAAETLRNARVDPFAAPKIITPAAAEKLLAKTPLGKRGGEALVEKLAHKPVTGESLVPESDPRPALTLGNPFVPLTD